MSTDRSQRLSALRARLRALDPGGVRRRVLPFGDARLDGRLGEGGLALGAWHEVAGAGSEAETAAAPAAFLARLAARAAGAGEVVWIGRRADLHAPGLEQAGLAVRRLILVAAGSDAEVLAALEDALRTRGVGAAVGEAPGADLTAGRRLQLACERGGATGFLLRRSPWGRPAAAGGEEAARGSAAATRWRVEAAPGEPAPGEPGLGPPRWRAELVRARGGGTGAWLLEAQNDAQTAFRVVAELADHASSAGEPRRLAR